MNATELKSRAERLATRLNEMGFTKNGKPLVVDHAFELVAAEEGFRNQHILRSKLSAYPALFIPPILDEEFAKAVLVQHTLDQDDWDIASEAWDHIVKEAAKRAGVQPVTAETELAAELAWVNVVNRQGWNDSSEILHLEAFIRERGLMGELAKYAEQVAAEESAADVDRDDEACEAVIAALKGLGYRVVISDFKRPYWEFGEESSLDFDTEIEAWADAWKNAQDHAQERVAYSEDSWSSLDRGTRIALVVKHLGNSVDRLRVLADQVFEGYDFGDSMSVEDAGGWEWSFGNTLATRSVFVKDSEQPDADSVRYRFMVEFKAGAVIGTNLSK
jgi:hypothetical protein